MTGFAAETGMPATLVDLQRVVRILIERLRDFVVTGATFIRTGHSRGSGRRRSVLSKHSRRAEEHGGRK
jgi:hypothetical protein